VDVAHEVLAQEKSVEIILVSRRSRYIRRDNLPSGLSATLLFGSTNGCSLAVACGKVSSVFQWDCRCPLPPREAREAGERGSGPAGKFDLIDQPA